MGGVKLPNGQEVTNIEWKMFRIEDVLEWQPQKEIDPLKLEKLKDVNKKLYPFYGQATINNGIISYNQLVDEVLNNKEGKSTILIHSNNQNTVYLETPFYLKDGHGATSVLQSEKLNKLNALYFMSSIKKVILSKYSYNAKATKIELNKSSILFFTVIFNKQKQNLLSGLVRDVDKAYLTAKIHLPTQNGQIDFAFMEQFIAELEAERIVELEAYLRVTGLSDYILTEEERAVLEAFRSGKISWGGKTT